MMKKLAVLLVCGLLLLQIKGQVSAASVTEIRNEAVLSFPESILFSAELESATPITKVRLHYGTLQDTCGKVSAIAFPEVTPGKRVTVEWDWQMLQSGGEPPGATIWWQWEVFDESGASTFTERQEVTWLDETHPWQTLSQGLIRLHYYYDDDAYGKTLKDTAVAALDRLADDIGIVPDEPIDLYIYSSTEDLRDAVFYEAGWTGGLAYSDYNIVLIGIAPTDMVWGKATEAHELTHVLEGDYTFSCLGYTPTWLSEGLAVYGEGGPSQSELQDFEFNRTINTLFSFRVLSGGFPEDPDLAGLAYSQSYAMVDYLIDEYGKTKMLDFLSAIKAGDEVGAALQKTYGFDLDGFEAEWRDAQGVPPVTPVEDQSSTQPTFVPTIAPIQGAQSQTSAGSNAVATPQPDSPEVNNQADAPEEPGTPMTITQRIVEVVNKLLPWMLGCMGFVILLVIVLFIVLRKKGGRA